MKKAFCLLTIGLAGALVPEARAGDVREGLVSYWPFETVTTDSTTPDLSFANNLQLNNLSAADLGTGTRGNAFSFDGTTKYLSVQHSIGNADTGLPVYRAGSYTVLMWVKGAAQTARYLFAEASNTSNNPLFLLQTGQAAGNNIKLDVIIRTDAGAVLINHVVSSAVVFDNDWHHIAWVDNRGSAKLYVDGNLDPANFNYNYLDGAMSFSTTAVGALVRAAVSGYFNGSIDEVAVWERALGQSEVQEVMTNGIATPVPPRAPFLLTQPVSVTRNVGDWALFSVTASGNRPFSYQWYTNGEAIPAANSQTYRASNLTTNDSGTLYSATVANASGSTNSNSGTLTVLPDPPPDVTRGILYYWPFDTVTNVVNGATNYYSTPDLYSRNDMQLVNLTDANLVPGRFDSALSYDGFTQFAYRVGGFSIYTATNYSISMWVNADGLTQNDRRIFSEGSTTNANALFGLGTDATGANESVRIFVRTDGNATVLDRNSTRPVFNSNNEWHHIVWVDKSGQGKLYVDGVLDETDFTYTRGSLTPNTTSVGAVLRADSTNWFYGAADEVATWNRALFFSEIQKIMSSGIPRPVAATPPSIVQQPIGASVYTRSTVTFSVTATGTSPLYYQWFKNNSPILGASNDSVTLTNVQLSAAGTYKVAVTNEADSVTSDAAVLVVTQRPAPPASLAIDFNDRSATANDTPPGFDSFILTGIGATTASSSYLYGGVEVTLSSLGSNLDTRKRATPTNSAGFTLEKLLQDFVFATSTTDTNGLGVTVKYLDANQPYNVTVWSFDSGSVNTRVSDWFVNGALVKEAYGFDGNVLPQDDSEDQFTIQAASDGEGTLAVEARRNLASGSQIGVFLNALKIEIAQFRIAAVERRADGKIHFTIQTPDIAQEHRVQQTASLSNVSWAYVPGVTMTTNGNTLEVEFTPDPGDARFYRMTRSAP